jgi:RNA polymerase sigma factor (sigma-70 family)
MPVPVDESELLPQAIAGDRGALSRLLLHYYDDLLRFVEQRLSGAAAGAVSAEDVLQQVFVRAALAITGFEPRTANSFRSWLLTIAGNLVRDIHKRRRRERRAEYSADLASSSNLGLWRGTSPGADHLATDSTSPSMRVHNRDSVQRLRDAMSKLPAQQQEVLQRYYLQYQSLDQIAQAMNCTKTTVRGICYRARQNLRAELGHSSMFFTH